VPAATILSDDTGGARLAADRLLAAGCRHLALIGSGSGTPSIARRIDAFRARLQGRGLEPVLWQEGPTAYATGAAAAAALLPHHGIDGAFCVTDLLAMGFMDAARHQHGRHIARDLSIIGFDDIPEAAWRAYDLTTLQQSMPALTNAVMRAIERAPKDDEGTSTTVPVTLIERSSVRKIR
jgi:DNA-binding LacI/PurR family transcriptional regulator